jgi:hypothetical protein
MSLNVNDLNELLRTKIHVDEFESKMGKDDDIIVISFKLRYRDPATDLVNFLEKGYDWVLDADVSAGSLSDGSWVVFIESERRPSITKKLLDLLDDLKSLSGNAPDEYTFRYKKDTKYIPVTADNFNDTVPLTPREYRRRNKSQELQAMLGAAGVPNKDTGEFSPDVREFVNLSKR